jgi:hypothetical protein
MSKFYRIPVSGSGTSLQIKISKQTETQLQNQQRFNGKIIFNTTLIQYLL